MLPAAFQALDIPRSPWVRIPKLFERRNNIRPSRGYSKSIELSQSANKSVQSTYIKHIISHAEYEKNKTTIHVTILYFTPIVSYITKVACSRIPKKSMK